MWAMSAKNSRVDLIDLLVGRGSATQQPVGHRSQLILSTLNGCTTEVEALLERKAIIDEAADDETLVCIAVFYGHVDII